MIASCLVSWLNLHHFSFFVLTSASPIKVNLVNMQGENVAWCPTAVLKTDSQWHLCLLYINGPDYVQRGEAVVFDAILPPDIENGPMTLRLRVITDIRGDA